MSVDIRDLLEDAAAEPATRPDYDALWARAQRRRRIANAGVVVAVAAAVALVGGLASVVTADRTPAIMDRPDERRPAPADVDLPATEYAVDADQLENAPERTTSEVVATFPRGDGAGEIARDDKAIGPRSLSAFLPCASGGWCSDGAYAGFGLLDGARNRILVHRAVPDDGLLTLPLDRWGYASPGTLLLQRVRGWDVAFVTVGRNADGAGMQRLLAIDLGSQELLADVPLPGVVADPTLVFGTAPESPDTSRMLWVRVDDGWRAVLREATDAETNALAFDAVVDAVVSTRPPLDARTHAAVELDVSRVGVVWEAVDRSWAFPRDATVRAAHPTVDGLLTVLQDGEDGETALYRLVGPAVVTRTPLGAPDEGTEYVFQPDGTLLVMDAGVDGAAVVTAHRPTSYARASRFVGGVPGTLRIIDGAMWVIDECYVSPLPAGPPAVCAAQEAVEGAASTALVAASIDVDGRPREDGIRLLVPLPGTARPDLVGARWAEVGGELVHLGVRALDRMFVYEIDTATLRPAVRGEFDPVTGS